MPLWSFINVASVPLAYKGGFSQELLEASPLSHGTNDGWLQGEPDSGQGWAHQQQGQRIDLGRVGEHGKQANSDGQLSVNM